MKRKASQLFWAGWFIFAITSLVYAQDTIVVTGRKIGGTFKGFDGGKFLFHDDKGKKLKETSSRVDKLILDPARTVSVIFSGKEAREGIVCKGFEKSKFVLEEDGKDISRFASQVSRIVVPEPKGGGVEGEEVGGGDKPLVIDLKSLSEWMKEGQATAEQTKAFDCYKAARDKYNSFLETSAAMVEAMNKTTGPAREDYLNKLRKRKLDEQPITADLKQAEKQLLSAFPQIQAPAGSENKKSGMK